MKKKVAREENIVCIDMRYDVGEGPLVKDSL